MCVWVGADDTDVVVVVGGMVCLAVICRSSQVQSLTQSLSPTGLLLRTVTSVPYIPMFWMDHADPDKTINERLQIA